MTARFPRLSMLALVGAATAGPYAAAKQPSAPTPSVENVYWMVDCLVKQKDRELELVLSTVPGDGFSQYHWMRAAIGPCLVEGRPVPNQEFYNRGAVAERFLYRDFASIGGSPRRQPLLLFSPVGSAYLAKAAPDSLVVLTMLDAASCLVRAEPEQTYAFFRLERGSAEEMAAVRQMAGAFAGCVTNGQPITLTPTIFRAFLAEAAYRVAAGKPEVFEVRSDA